MYTQLNYNLIDNLDNLINTSIKNQIIFKPISKNRFKYKNFQVVKNQFDRWDIYESKKVIGQTFLKLSAFAMCRARERNLTNLIVNIENYDKVYEINYLNIQQYQHIATNSIDRITKQTAAVRLEESENTIKSAKGELDRAFYSSFLYVN